MGKWMQRMEGCGKSCQQPPEARRGYGQVCPQSLPKEQISSAPWSPSFDRLKTETADQKMPLFFLPSLDCATLWRLLTLFPGTSW